MSFARTDKSAVAQWWWSVDRWTLLALAALVGFGSLLVMAASPSVAERIGVDHLHFVRRYFAVLPAALAVMFAVSLQTPRNVRRIAIAGFAVAVALMAATLFIGVEIKGARRWIELPWFSLQPSEFVKPCFAVLSAWLFAKSRETPAFPGQPIAVGLFLLVLFLLIRQPDFGMAFVVSAVWFTQFFLAGLRLAWAAACLGTGGLGLVAAYFTLPHVQSRIDRFLDPASGDSYQIDRSMDAFMNGGLWGRGPGEGTVKNMLPDAHADFVFAVAGEELGLIVCLVIVVLFAFIVLRGLLAAVAGEQPVHRHRGHRPVRAVRVAGGHQHGVGAPPDADQGHDAALHLLRRLVAFGLGPRHGHGAGLDAAAFRRRRPMSGLIVLAAGGTGGHIFPAEALAGELLGRGLKVALVTDGRGQAFGGRLPGVDLHRIRAGRPGGSLLSKLAAAAEIALGFIAARKLLRDLAPDAAVGFGGYPSVPTMLAAARIGLPTLLHEQNARLGRANRWLAPRVRRIATSFAEVDGLDAAERMRAVETGNPVRAAIAAARSTPYAAPNRRDDRTAGDRRQPGRAYPERGGAGGAGAAPGLAARPDQPGATGAARGSGTVRAAHAANGIKAETVAVLFRRSGAPARARIW